MTDAEVQKPESRYAFLILAGCCCVAGGGVMALVVSMMSVYLVPVSSALGMTRPEFTMWNTTMGFVQIVSLPIWGQLIGKNVRACFAVGVICEIIGILMFTVVTDVFGMVIAGIFIGISMPMTFKLLIPTLMNNWFAPKHRGRYLGIAMAFSGVGTFVWAPMFTAIIENFGYQTSYIVNAIIAAVLLLPWLGVFRFSPEDKGLKPWGYVPGEDVKAADMEEGMSASKALTRPVFWALFVAIGLICLANGFNNNMRPMAAEMLANTDLAASAAMIAATMVSTSAAGNLIGKIVYGYSVDKIGLQKGTIIFLVIFFMSFVLWTLFPGQMVFMYIGAFCLGLHNGLVSVGIPLITRRTFGNRDYAKIYSRIAIAQAIMGGSATTIVTAYAASIGTNVGIEYTIFGMLSVIVVGALMLFGISRIGKEKWTHEAIKEA